MEKYLEDEYETYIFNYLYINGVVKVMFLSNVGRIYICLTSTSQPIK